MMYKTVLLFQPTSETAPFVADPLESDKTAAAYIAQLNSDPDAEFVQLDLTPCVKCGRKFVPAKLQKHQNVCQAAAKKRKVYNMSKMRTQGTEQAQFVKNSKRGEPVQVSSWRKMQCNHIVSGHRDVSVCQDIYMSVNVRT